MDKKTDSDIKRHLEVKYLRFYLESTYKQKFKVKYVTPTHLLIEWVGLPHTHEIRECVIDDGIFATLDKLQLVQHRPDFPDTDCIKQLDIYPINTQHKKKLPSPVKYLRTKGVTVLIDGCRHVLIGIVVFTLRTWMIDR